ncbi:EF-hand domain-containing protein [uncultured Shewanella sp.]|uniref:EF-hand domain-containing protein n=1 Tax=Shewanella atlantica TaxID=271099 RepID=UPI00262F6FD3|nr:EF-hand domain-containing protein [uncultured Shewanella sp.]
MEIITGSMRLALIAAVIAAIVPVKVMATDIQAEQHEELPVNGPIPFAVFDRDNSGFITAEEFDATRNARMAMKASENRPMHGKACRCSFTQIDKDGDGKLTKEELENGQHVNMQARREMMRQGKGMGQGMGRGMGMGKNMPAFADFDIDGDGSIVESEFTEARSQRMKQMGRQGRQMKNMSHAPSFTDIDLDGDGKINSEEFAAHQLHRHQHMKPKL